MAAVLLPLCVFAVAVFTSMVGRGGGNFYVPLLVAGGAPMHQAATSAQLILVSTSIAASVVYQRHRVVDWKLALVIDPPTDVMAFFGGLYASKFAGSGLKFLFAGLLVVASFLMLLPITERVSAKRRFGYWYREFGEYRYSVNLFLAIPATAAVGFVAGMVGISGGSFKIPLMVLACGVPMKVAVGTSMVMVGVTALTGFVGHAVAGDFNASLAVPVAAAAVIGGIIGGRISIRTSGAGLKKLFAFTTLAAALFMGVNASMSR